MCAPPSTRAISSETRSKICSGRASDATVTLHGGRGLLELLPLAVGDVPNDDEELVLAARDEPAFVEMQLASRPSSHSSVWSSPVENAATSGRQPIDELARRRRTSYTLLPTSTVVGWMPAAALSWMSRTMPCDRGEDLVRHRLEQGAAATIRSPAARRGTDRARRDDGSMRPVRAARLSRSASSCTIAASARPSRSISVTKRPGSATSSRAAVDVDVAAFRLGARVQELGGRVTEELSDPLLHPADQAPPPARRCPPARERAPEEPREEDEGDADQEHHRDPAGDIKDLVCENGCAPTLTAKSLAGEEDRRQRTARCWARSASSGRRERGRPPASTRPRRPARARRRRCESSRYPRRGSALLGHPVSAQDSGSGSTGMCRSARAEQGDVPGHDDDALESSAIRIGYAIKEVNQERRRNGAHGDADRPEQRVVRARDPVAGQENPTAISNSPVRFVGRRVARSAPPG